MNIILALVMALSVALTMPLPAPSQAPSQASTQAPSQPAQGDSGCTLTGPTQCDTLDREDAWKTLDTSAIDLDGPNGGLYIDYIRKLDRMPLSTPSGQFVVASDSKKGIYYVFEYKTLSFA